MRLRWSAALLVAFAVLGQPAFAAVQLVTPVPEQVNLGTLVTAAGTLPLPTPAAPQPRFDVNSLPRMLPLDDPVIRIAAVNESLTQLFDPVARTVVGSVSGASIGGILTVIGQSDLLFIERSAGHETLVRRERTTGREVWGADLGDGFVVATIRTISGFRSTTTIVESAPIIMAWNAANQRLSLLGLEYAAKQRVLADPIYTNRLVSIDWNSGAVISDERFDLDREAGGGRRILVKLNRDARAKPTGGGTFKVISLTGDTIMSGQLESGDLPVTFAKMPARGDWGDYFLDPLWVGSELWLCAFEHSLNVKNKKVKWTRSDTWTRFDSQGKRLGNIEPPLRTQPRYLLLNKGTSPWPKYFTRHATTCKEEQSNCEDAILAVAEDGSVSARPLLLPNGELPDATDSFHEGEVAYFLSDGGLYRSSPGERSSTLVVPPIADDKYWRIPLASDGFAILLGNKKSTVVNYRDGSTAPRGGGPGEFTGFLWSLADGLIQIRDGLPATGLPSAFDRYEDGIATNSLGTVRTYSCWDCPRLRGLRVWGSDDAGDVILVPGLLKGGQAILVGVEWPANRVAFWLPIARVKGLVDQEPPGGSPFPYVVYSKGAFEAGLAVLEDLHRIRLYTVRRPGATSPPALP